MPARDPGPEIKKPDAYEAMRDEGMSEEKAARISNSQANGSIDHDSSDLEDRTKEQLYDEAKDIGIPCRSDMSKAELVDAIRNH